MELTESMLKQYILEKPEAAEDYPFGPDVAVFKVLGKMFALVSSEDGILNLNLKCDPVEAVQLRDLFSAVRPGYHMNKKHWNTVIIDGSLPNSEIERMIDNSYSLVVKGLTKAARTGLEIRHGKAVIYKTS
ncbi:MmcQ/YjbR family DNA-binding protein [Zooshikella ganghwensis]|uniref:MmcQ/YjbR family DNA-binding protein n=1 Tax=Zooshikella ganghwensis TaxID=202772 RepID=UPI0004229262|nr:MmcQ/YjbR family DNA-binding protein [Zooshikella ganghwensis]